MDSIKFLKKAFYVLLVVLSIFIGLYPLQYLADWGDRGFLDWKGPTFLSNKWWYGAFYIHILLGGVALLIGWIQFSKKILRKYNSFHRAVGYTYVLATWCSSVAAIYMSFFAKGGLIAMAGFFCIGIIWLYTTASGWFLVKHQKIQAHQKMMIYSYAACFGAVTLRLWTTLLPIVIDDFNTSYRIVAWLSWVPNLIVAYFLVRKMGLTKTSLASTDVPFNRS